MEKFDFSDFVFTFGISKAEISFGGDSDQPADWTMIPLTLKADVNLDADGGWITLETIVALPSLLGASENSCKFRLRLSSKAQSKDGLNGFFTTTIYNVEFDGLSLEYGDDKTGSFKYEFIVNTASFDDSGNPVNDKVKSFQFVPSPEESLETIQE